MQTEKSNLKEIYDEKEENKQKTKKQQQKGYSYLQRYFIHPNKNKVQF
jgi:hypothetical protein